MKSHCRPNSMIMCHRCRWGRKDLMGMPRRRILQRFPMNYGDAPEVGGVGRPASIQEVEKPERNLFADAKFYFSPRISLCKYLSRHQVSISKDECYTMFILVAHMFILVAQRFSGRSTWCRRRRGDTRFHRRGRGATACRRSWRRTPRSRCPRPTPRYTVRACPSSCSRSR